MSSAPLTPYWGHPQHDHFRHTWQLLYNACTSGRRPANMTLKQFIDEGISLTRYLETHHGIEETYLFPLLARKMPQFQAGSGRGKTGAAELLRQHQQIHAGSKSFPLPVLLLPLSRFLSLTFPRTVDVFVAYLRSCRNRECELELSVMKEKMDSWGPVLLKHLDQEVETLGAENMRKYWTMEEMKAIPI